MTIKTSAHGLRYLHNWAIGNPDYNDYRIINRETVKRTVTRPLPFRTNALDEGEYLHDYAQYYREVPHHYGYILRDEYYRDEGRPTYEIEISYELLEVELTERGMTKARKRYDFHKRNADRYAKLLGKGV